MTESERAILQAMVDDLYDQFVTVVAEGRHLAPERVRQLADGRVYTGRQALALGLVDSMGTMEDAVNAAAKEAAITGKPQLKEYGRGGLWDMIWGASDRALLEGLLGRLFQTGGTGTLIPSSAGTPQLR